MSLLRDKYSKDATKSTKSKLSDAMKTKSASKQANYNSFSVVALGASAGGLEALQEFFNHLPMDLGMAFIIITHLEPSHTSQLTEILKNNTKMEVQQIEDGTTIEPNVVYVIPPNKNVEIKKHTLYLKVQSKPHFAVLPINFFLESLAKNRKDQSFAIILSGTGSDGTLGIREIKRSNGIVIVQEPANAKYDSMPQSAINTGIVDYILPVQEIPGLLLKLSKGIDLTSDTDKNIKDNFGSIFQILRKYTGHDFSAYKINTISRRIERQMAFHHIYRLADYAPFLEANTQEIEILFQDLLIGVTSFFRDPEAFEVLKTKAICPFLEKIPADYAIRIWIPGCSTGEEAYSVAIIMRECLNEMQLSNSVHIFGTDIDTKSLEIARSGIYPEMISADVSDQRLNRFFIKEQNQYKVKPEIRKMVIFGPQNIIKDPPFTKLDMISCRNLLIYLNEMAQKKLFPLFHYSLKSTGILFLGTSEALAGYGNLFRSLDQKWKIYTRKNKVSPEFALLDFPHIHPINKTVPTQKNEIVIPKDRPEVVFDKFLLGKYLLPCVIINSNGKILYKHPNLASFKVKMKGASDIIFNYYPKKVRTKLISAIEKASRLRKEIVLTNIPSSNLTHKTNTVNLRINPTDEITTVPDALLITFEDRASAKDIRMITKKYGSVIEMRNKLLDMSTHLRNSQEHLQSTIEELESSNEELQSTNEELQSSNEELETSKEELQSLNEELTILNSQLENRIDHYTTLNDDMINLFNSTEVIAIFLDNNLLIKRYTPKAKELINLIPADIGRSIKHITTNLHYNTFVEDAQEVLTKLTHKKIEVISKTNQNYLVHIIPYRTTNNVIDGVIATFTDITFHKNAEMQLNLLNDELRLALDYAENVINTIRDPFLVLDESYNIISANRSFYNAFKLSAKDVVNKNLFIIDCKFWENVKLKKILEDTFQHGDMLEDYTLEHDVNGIKKEIILNARIIKNSAARLVLLSMTIEK